MGEIALARFPPTIVAMPTRPPAVQSTTRHAHPPAVHLGQIRPGGLAPAILAIVERGVHHRPALAQSFSAEVELAMDERYPPVRIAFGERPVLVEDGPCAPRTSESAGRCPTL